MSIPPKVPTGVNYYRRDPSNAELQSLTAEMDAEMIRLLNPFIGLVATTEVQEQAKAVLEKYLKEMMPRIIAVRHPYELEFTYD